MFLKILCIMTFLSSLRIVLWSNIWPILEDTLHALDENVYSVVVGWNGLNMFVRSIWYKASFKSKVYWYFCVWMMYSLLNMRYWSPLLLSYYFPLQVCYICLVYLSTLMLDTYIIIIVIASQWINLCILT